MSGRLIVYGPSPMVTPSEPPGDRIPQRIVALARADAVFFAQVLDRNRDVTHARCLRHMTIDDGQWTMSTTVQRAMLPSRRCRIVYRPSSVVISQSVPYSANSSPTLPFVVPSARLID